MSVLWVALPVALMMAAGAVAAFLWVVRSGQLDDLETPPIRILLDDESKSTSTVRTEKSSSK
jgi:cbb3-type cytochrome oxidase maturation protein